MGGGLVNKINLGGGLVNCRNNNQHAVCLMKDVIPVVIRFGYVAGTTSKDLFEKIAIRANRTAQWTRPE
jgi:hypothetical protein